MKKSLIALAVVGATVGAVQAQSVTLYGRIDKPRAPKLARGQPPSRALKGHRKAIFDPSGKPTRTPIYDGGRLGAGATVASGELWRIGLGKKLTDAEKRQSRKELAAAGATAGALYGASLLYMLGKQRP